MTQLSMLSQFNTEELGADIMTDQNLDLCSGPTIKFEKWYDPYIKTKEQKEEEDNFKEENGWEDEMPRRSLLTPFGGLSIDCPITEHFKLYIGQTNFSITAPIMKVIEATEGCETLDIYTRYRFRIGVGNLFLPQQVFQDIRRRVLKLVKKKSNLILEG